MLPPICVVCGKQGKFEDADRLCSRVIGILGTPIGGEQSNYAAALNRRAELLKAEVRIDKVSSRIVTNRKNLFEATRQELLCPDNGRGVKRMPQAAYTV